MTESILVERIDGKLRLTLEEADGRTRTPVTWDSTEDHLHSELVRDGYLRVGPVKGDQIAGLYVRKVAA